MTDHPMTQKPPMADDEIVHALAKELARYDRRDHYRDEEELNRCAGFPIYEVPAKQFLIMWRVMRNLGALERIEKQVDLR